MAGPAYLVSKNGSGVTHPGESKTEKEEAAFPDLMLVLQGGGVWIDLTGVLFVSEKNIAPSSRRDALCLLGFGGRAMDSVAA